MCSIAAHDVFGPTVDGCLDGFDFTLLFEEAIMTLGPLTLVLLVLVVPRVATVWKSKVCVRRGSLYYLKMFAWILYAIVNIVLLAALTANVPKTRLSIPTLAVTVFSVLPLGLLSHLEHTRSVRPSSILTLSLFFGTLLDIPRVRTLWSIDANTLVAGIFTALVPLKFGLLVVESLEKHSLLLSSDEKYPPEALSGIISRSLFWWLNPLFRRGFREVLSIETLFDVDKNLGAELAGEELQKTWDAEKDISTGPNTLAFILFRQFRWQLVAAVLPRLILTGFTFCQPFAASRFINYISSEEPADTKAMGYGLIGAYAIIYVGIALATALYQHQVNRLAVMVRAALIPVIYRKTLNLQIHHGVESSGVTMISTDLERIAFGLRDLHEIWATLIEIALAIWLLARQLEVASVMPAVVFIICTLAIVQIAGIAARRQKVWLEATQDRLARTADLLKNLKVIKMTGLGEIVSKTVVDFRNREIIKSTKYRSILIIMVVLSYSGTVLTPMFTLAVFTFIAEARGNNTILDNEKAVTSLILFNLFGSPMSLLIDAVSGIATAISSLQRIQEYLGEEQIESRPVETDDNTNRAPPSTAKSADGSEVQIVLHQLARHNTVLPEGFDRSLSFFCQDVDVLSKQSGEILLHNLSFSIPRAQVTMVVGPVGCGKSLLLKLLLGELPTSRPVQNSISKAAYCGQSPWIMNATIKQNIIGPLQFDVEWYKTVVHACCLEHDFQVLPLQDETMAGSAGALLSGGQQKRIALARALYARQDVNILDDVLTGLDNTTEQLVFARVFGHEGLLRERKATVVLVTNSIHRLPSADHIMVLGESGNVVEHGTYEDLEKASGYIEGLALQSTVEVTTKEAVIANISNPAITPESTPPDVDRRLGDSTLYLYYIRSVGWINVLVFLALCCLFVFAVIFPQYWVTWWSQANSITPNQRVAYYVGIYFFLVVLAVAALSSACAYLMYTIYAAAARKMHAILLETAMRAQLSSFTSTDVGVTINRFSQDLELIDLELPLAIFSTAVVFLMCIAQTVVICMSSAYLAAAIPVAFLALYSIQLFYLRTSRQLRILDIEAKSPLFSQFLETLSGLGTIRALGWGRDFARENSVALNASQKPHYGLLCVQRWLNLVLGLLVAGIAVITVAVAVAMKGSANGGFVGLALLNIVSLGTQLQGFITSWATLESALGAIARVRSFPLETKAEKRSTTVLAPEWPARGDLDFRQVYAYHEKPRRLVLDNISFRIQHGQKIAICGRTGSGKSSLISVICRALEIDSGSVLVDGVDLAAVDHQELRSRITIISQEPYILKGTVRENVDPTGIAADEDIETALRAVYLYKLVADMGGLDADMSLDSLSSGQRQLMCLARGVLRRRSIVILDEATSSVDVDTEALMQTVIRENFKNSTVISITHKLTNLDVDMIGVLKDGRLVEYDEPSVLLATPGSLFNQLRGSLE